MSINTTSSNYPQGQGNGHHPPPAAATMLEPSVIQAMANQLFTALPNDPGVTVPVNQTTTAIPTGVATTPVNSTTTAVPTGVSAVPQIANDRLPGANTLGTAPSHPAQVPEVVPDPLTALAQQLYGQMQATGSDPSLQQELSQLSSSIGSSGLGNLPTEIPASNGANLPTALEGLANRDEFNISAIAKLAQDLSGQIPHRSDLASSVASTSHPIAAVPASEADLGRFGQSIDRSTAPLANLHLDPGGVPFDVHVIRQDFPILHQRVNGNPLIWLDNAATTQKPASVIDSISRYYERDNSNIHRAAHTLAARATDAYEGAREKVQRFLGASDAAEIIFARGTTEAINLVAQTFGHKYIKQGDEIILSTLEHHANIVPWQMLAQQTGAVLKVIPITDRGEIVMEEYTRLLNPRTRLVAISQVSNALGTIIPVAEITHLAHRHGARVLIDGAQAVSHMPVNVQAIDCDFYVFSGHKLFAPTGIGALYAKKELLADLPPWQGGGSMIRHVTFEQTIYSDPPAKFEAGTPNIADAVGLGAAIDYITRLGMTNIERYEHQLTDYAMLQLSRIPGLRLIGTAAHKVSVLSFVLKDIPTELVGQRLAQAGIAVRAGHHCAQPTLQRYGLTASVRPSLAFYNTHAEIDRLVEVVKTIGDL